MVIINVYRGHLLETALLLTVAPKGPSNIPYRFTIPNNVWIRVGGWTGRLDFQDRKKSLHPEIPFFIKLLLLYEFSLLPISVIFPWVNSLLGLNFMDK